MAATVPFTADQLTREVFRALEAGDALAAVDAVEALAAMDRQRAREILNGIELGLTEGVSQ